MGIIAALASTVATLATILAAYWRNRIAQLETSNARCEKRFNKVVSLVIAVAGDTKSFQEMREELARVLEGD